MEREETVQCFVRAFETLGYKSCEHGRVEFGYQKIAIYVESDFTPTHMARQTLFGGWLSKLGDLEDIFHKRLEDVEGPTYGKAITFLTAC